ncbi:MAG TPA: 23S rRNA (guanosine(2251)-2'-O)-methyltransferase RlmB [Lapidilactobacillus dextrinicus]|uniref:23S rRNA (Guanosine(2251)-2'-O)-methyltransferase RlmB n=1 Tax=Lapidilactobacillus dextrinicus TaxID=51664 RepID=A0A921DV13_9LACO|nr:23S rRNA (guanosine(2251)-2'-O)-methyltransferase RlmB [Lapidilactobacillus dextrinicus]
MAFHKKFTDNNRDRQNKRSNNRKKSDGYDKKSARPHKQDFHNKDSENTVENDGEFVYGKHAVLEFIASGDVKTVNKIFLQNGLRGDLANTVQKFARDHHLVLQEVPKAKLDDLTDEANHQGVLLTLSPYQYVEVADILAKAKAADEDPLLLILDNLNDPHNLGSILRTADAVGVHGVIIPKRRAVGVTGVVAKTAAGALEHVDVARVTNLADTIDQLKEAGVWVFGTAMSGEDYRGWNSTGPLALVIGNEGKGISTLVAKKVDGMVTIPMIGHVQSLNASVATSILLYHIFDQRHPRATKVDTE